ncbi:MAG: HDOD domain-containing protein [Chitinivorax sp.]
MEINLQEAEKLLKGIAIPPRPAILDDVNREASKDEPNFGKIAQLIGQDVGLSAAMLKTVNSPLFGLSKRVSSVQQAVALLGIRNTVNIITGLALKASMSGNKLPRLERFWDSAALEAMVSACIASQLPGAHADASYTFGLFQNCGIPLLMQRFPDYIKTLHSANSSTDREFTAIEDEQHATNHASVGYLMARSWYLPESICQAILCHHDLSIFDSASHEINAEVSTLIAITRLAEHIAHGFLRLTSDNEWEKIGARALQHLGLGESEYEDLRDQIHQMMSQE